MTDPETASECDMIIVMGVTGSGKSYFINKLAQGSVSEGGGLHSGKLDRYTG
jgi:predicted GTPase